MSKAKKKSMKAREVVINGCFGGFSLSPKALLLLWERGMKSIGTSVDTYWGDNNHGDHERDLNKWRAYLANPPKDITFMFLTVFTPDEKFVLNGGREIKRDDPELVRVVKELGDKADGSCARLEIVKIPADVEWQIEEYDGSEHISEVHRTWR